MTHKNLNGGKPTEIFYPITDEEFTMQFDEIFDGEHYKAGKQKGVFVDIGANIGLTALYFQDYATEYYALEPSSACFQALELNTKHLPNVKRFNVAIGHENGKDYLLQTAQEGAPQSFFDGGKSIYGRELVSCVRLDSFCEENKIERIDVCKIDVESAEYIILPSEGFARVAPKIDLIIGEAHYNFNDGTVPEIVPVILSEYGFQTSFEELTMPNMKFAMTYDPPNGKKKEYIFQTSTIFVGRKK